ncbi:hypothetical protein ACFQ9X_33640 [Catenulispora yoronensis]
MTAGGPTHQQLIARDRLLNLLDAATAGKVTVISAPAGSGKTSLLRNWVDLAEGGGPGRQPGRVAYIPGEQFRGESQPFWLSVLDAVRYPVSRAGRERRRPLRTSRPPASWTSFSPSSPRMPLPTAGSCWRSTMSMS